MFVFRICLWCSVLYLCVGWFCWSDSVEKVFTLWEEVSKSAFAHGRVWSPCLRFQKVHSRQSSVALRWPCAFAHDRVRSPCLRWLCICSWQSLVALLEATQCICSWQRLVALRWPCAFVHDRVRSPCLRWPCAFAHDRAWSPCLRWFCAFALGRVRWPWGDLWIWRDVEIVQLLTKSANSWIGLEFFLKRKSFELHPVRGTQWKMVSTFPKPPT